MFRGGFENGVVVKLNPPGSALVYSTYLGGSQDTGGSEFAQAIAVDAAGNAYVTGATSSFDFPIVNALQPTFGGSADAFGCAIRRLRPEG